MVGYLSGMSILKKVNTTEPLVKEGIGLAAELLSGAIDAKTSETFNDRLFVLRVAALEILTSQAFNLKHAEGAPAVSDFIEAVGTCIKTGVDLMQHKADCGLLTERGHHPRSTPVPEDK